MGLSNEKLSSTSSGRPDAQTVTGRALGEFGAFWDELQDKVPHARHIAIDDARAWHASALRSGKPVLWHFNRLMGVGGSEIGALVCAELGQAHPLGMTPAKLFDAKMLKVPLFSSPAMRFGIEQEPVIREMFEKRMPGWRRDDDTLALMESLSRQRAWKEKTGLPLAYSPDDLFIDQEGRRILVDYKAPFSGEAPNEVPLNYAAQLMQGALLSQRIGKPVAQMALIYGLMPGNTQKNAQNQEKPCLIVFDGIVPDPYLMSLIERVSQDFMLRLESNDRPLAVSESQRDALIEHQSVWLDIQRKIAMLKDDAAKIEEKMSGILAGIPPSMTSSCGLNLVVRNTFTVADKNIAALSASLKEIGIDINDWRGPDTPGPVDLNQVDDALRKAGDSIDNYRGPSIPGSLKLRDLIDNHPEVLGMEGVERKIGFSASQSVAPTEKRTRRSAKTYSDTLSDTSPDSAAKTSPAQSAAPGMGMGDTLSPS